MSETTPPPLADVTANRALVFGEPRVIIHLEWAVHLVPAEDARAVPEERPVDGVFVVELIGGGEERVAFCGPDELHADAMMTTKTMARCMCIPGTLEGCRSPDVATAAPRGCTVRSVPSGADREEIPWPHRSLKISCGSPRGDDQSVSGMNVGEYSRRCVANHFSPSAYRAHTRGARERDGDLEPLSPGVDHERPDLRAHNAWRKRP